jgi:hypothetical protein
MMTEEKLFIEALKNALEYNPETGVFTWKIRPYPKSAKRPGDTAGRLVRNKSGDYWAICYDSRQVPASKAAWAIHFGEWPNRMIRYKDGNSMNLSLDNLRLDMNFAVMPTNKALPKHQRVPTELRTKYQLKHLYGLDYEDFNKMIVEQNNCCAICDQPERAMINGKVKPLSVDHNHTTGKVRELLCSHCNHTLGHMCESPELLEKAAAYLRKHQRLAEAPLPNNVVKLKEAR